MDQNRTKKISKALSFWLRHKPEDIGLTMNAEGWVDVKELMEKAQPKLAFDFNELKYVVQNNDKKRFALSDDFCEIRANQGHSVDDVELTFKEVIPPQFLYHGTPNKSVEIIKKEGLKKMNRHHVHLSPDKETAAKVGSRRGEFTILQIASMHMRADGYKIYLSENGVYLVDSVPVKYITF